MHKRTLLSTTQTLVNMTSVRLIVFLMLTLLTPSIMCNYSRISRIQDLSFFHQIQEFAKWEEENLFKPQSTAPHHVNVSNETTSASPMTFHSSITNKTFVLPVVNKYLRNSSKLMNVSFFAQGKKEKKKKKEPNWTVTSGFFAGKEIEDVEDEEDECCFPVREIPVAKPPPRPEQPVPKPKVTYAPPPELFPEPGFWVDTSSSEEVEDDEEEEVEEEDIEEVESSSVSGESESESDDSCSDRDVSKLWFFGWKTPTTERRLSIVPSSKLVTRVSDEFHNLYIDPSSKKLAKRDFIDEYVGYGEDLSCVNDIDYSSIYQSVSPRIIIFWKKWFLFLFSFL